MKLKYLKHSWFLPEVLPAYFRHKIWNYTCIINIYNYGLIDNREEFDVRHRPKPKVTKRQDNYAAEFSIVKCWHCQERDPPNPRHRKYVPTKLHHSWFVMYEWPVGLMQTEKKTGFESSLVIFSRYRLSTCKFLKVFFFFFLIDQVITDQILKWYKK